jgi:hypothetical protein
VYGCLDTCGGDGVTRYRGWLVSGLVALLLEDSGGIQLEVHLRLVPCQRDSSSHRALTDKTQNRHDADSL